MLTVLFFALIAAEPTEASIAVSIRPLEFITKEIVGNEVIVNTIAAGNLSAHTYEPKPSDVKKLQTATIAIYVSPELDYWMVKHRKNEIYSFMDWVPPAFQKRIRFVHHHDHHHDHDDHDDHGNHDHYDHKSSHSDIDPHFWMDPLTVQASLAGLTAMLCTKFPSKCDAFKTNAAKFSSELQKLDQNIKETLKDKANRPVMTTHDFLGYLVARYNLDYLEPVEPIPGKESSPKDMARLSKLAKEKKLKTIFSEPQLNTQNVKVLAETAGIQHSILDPQGATSDIGTYTDLIQWNVEKLDAGL